MTNRNEFFSKVVGERTNDADKRQVSDQKVFCWDFIKFEEGTS